MSEESEINRAIAAAQAELQRPISPDERGWDEAHRQSWLEALASMERFLAGEASERGFSVIRSLDMGQGSEALDNPRAEALLRVARAFQNNGVDRYS